MKTPTLDLNLHPGMEPVKAYYTNLYFESVSDKYITYPDKNIRSEAELAMRIRHIKEEGPYYETEYLAHQALLEELKIEYRKKVRRIKAKMFEIIS